MVPAWLRRRLPASRSHLQHLERELEEARGAVVRWKVRCHESAVHLERAKAALANASDAVQWRRQVLSPRVVRHVLPQRLATAQVKAEGVEARARHEAFYRASAAYRSAIDADEYPPEGFARRLSVDGTTWWLALPRPESEAFTARAVAKEGFPYRALVQTRELVGGGIMLDLGANIGKTSVPRVIGGDVMAVYCAEPDPLNYACLFRNVVDNRLQGLVMPDRVAITGTPGRFRLARGKASGAHRLLFEPGGVAASEAGPEASAVGDIEGLTLDAWVARLGIDLRLVTFVKVDTQGAEPYVLAGASRVLAARHVAWQLEVAPDLLQAAGSSVGGLVERLQASFTHFIDLHRDARGQRARAIARLGDALARVPGDGQTDVLVYNAADAGALSSR